MRGIAYLSYIIIARAAGRRSIAGRRGGGGGGARRYDDADRSLALLLLLAAAGWLRRRPCSVATYAGHQPHTGCGGRSWGCWATAPAKQAPGVPPP
jgi:hypothetical protein